ncbi:hypothetical protein ACHAXH_002221 [Discostella pseudostelligera]
MWNGSHTLSIQIPKWRENNSSATISLGGGGSGQNFKDERECVFISCITTISIFFNWPSSTHGHMDRGGGGTQSFRRMK